MFSGVRCSWAFVIQAIKCASSTILVQPLAVECLCFQQGSVIEPRDINLAKVAATHPHVAYAAAITLGH